MKNIYVMPTVKEHASNKTVYVEIMQRKEVRASKGRRGEMKGVTFSEGDGTERKKGRRLTAVYVAT